MASSESEIMSAYFTSLHKDLTPGKKVRVKHFIEGNMVPINGNLNLPSGFEAVLKKQTKDNYWECEIAGKGICEIHPCYFEENQIKVFQYFLEGNTEFELRLEAARKEELSAKLTKKAK
jgi:hypothetical protein